MRTVYETAAPQKEEKINHITKWYGTVIARRHALLPLIRRIATHHIDSDVTTISLEGREGTGKTTLAKLVAHLVHLELAEQARTFSGSDQIKNKLQLGYCVRVFTADDLMDFAATLSKLPRQNRILIFDDVSFLEGRNSPKEMKKLLADVTTIRHLADGLDVKTILIFNYHYSRGFSTYLRDTDFRFYTSMRHEEAGRIGKTLSGKKNKNTLEIFKKSYKTITQEKIVKFGLGQKNNRTAVRYDYGKPFRLALFFDSADLGICVYPDGAEIVQKCSLCTIQETPPEVIDSLHDWLVHTVPPKDLRRACSIRALRKYGMATHSRSLSLSLEIIDRLVKNGFVDEDKLLEHVIRAGGRHTGFRASPQTKQTSIPKIIQDDFCERFGQDGLLGASEKNHKPI